MHLAGDGLEWRLRTELTNGFADKLDVLAESVSGHQYLDPHVIDDIPVEVSLGEYPANWRPSVRRSEVGP
jgi:hypothetical protein